MLINVVILPSIVPRVLTTSLSPGSIIGRGYTQASGEWRRTALAGDAPSSEATPGKMPTQAGFITVSPLRASYAAVEPSPFVLKRWVLREYREVVRHPLV